MLIAHRVIKRRVNLPLDCRTHNLHETKFHVYNSTQKDLVKVFL